MNKKALGKFKDEVGSLVMSEFCGRRAKTYSFLIDGLTDDDYENNAIANKKAKGTKKCVVKRSITFNDYVNSLFNDERVIRSQFVFRSHNHQIYTEKINKIALSSNDDKRIQTSDKITTYTYGYFDNDDINNTKSQLDILREDAQALRNKSKVLREEAYAIRNTSNAVREEVHAIIKESHTIKNNNTKSELDILREEVHDLRNKSKVLREEAHAIIKESHAIKNKLNKKVVYDNVKKMYNDIKDSIELIKKSIKANRKKIDTIKKETHDIKFIPQIDSIKQLGKKELDIHNNTHDITYNLQDIKKELNLLNDKKFCYLK